MLWGTVSWTSNTSWPSTRFPSRSGSFFIYIRTWTSYAIQLVSLTLWYCYNSAPASPGPWPDKALGQWASSGEGEVSQPAAGAQGWEWGWRQHGNVGEGPSGAAQSWAGVPGERWNQEPSPGGQWEQAQQHLQVVLSSTHTSSWSCSKMQLLSRSSAYQVLKNAVTVAYKLPIAPCCLQIYWMNYWILYYHSMHQNILDDSKLLVVSNTVY